MVRKGDYLFGENSSVDSLLSESDNNHHANGRVYYEYLRQEKVSQRTSNGSEAFDLPCDDSEYSSMFMTF